ncbi:hypothetical protein [Chlamydia sp. 17-3921]|uniref:hypothetical protein n=1 Tax=Chlamydia sp. 17-3921 TaxID=2675798 RepID=UPI00191A6274|nr:hypothetical protein [Chlamydia sp. 17-3921]
MSSWLSQANEILLNQTSFSPEISQAQKPKVIPYTITLASPSTAPSFSKMLFTKLCNSENSYKESSKSLNREVSAATTRQKILMFGSSLSSQLPKTVSSSPSSSPWNLFSNQNSREAKKTLLQELSSPKCLEEKEFISENLLENSEISTHQKDSQTQHVKTSATGLLPHSERFSPSLKRQIKSQELKEGEQTKSTLGKKEEFSPLKASLKELDKKSLFYDQDANKKNHQNAWFKKEKKNKQKVAKIIPIIPLPTLGIFTLSYLLTKQGILSDFSSYAYHKHSIDSTQQELDMLHEERLAQIKESIAKEESIKRWGSLSTIIGWISPLIAIGVGASAILSGGGVFAFLALFSGLIALVIAILTTMDRNPLEKLIPIKDRKTKQKVLNWLIIGLSILALGLSLTSLFIEKIGFSVLLEGSIKGLQPALETVIAIIRGGSIWMKSELEGLKAKFTLLETRIELTSLERDDNFSRYEELLDNMESSFESLNNLLNLMRELDQDHLNALRA